MLVWTSGTLGIRRVSSTVSVRLSVLILLRWIAGPAIDAGLPPIRQAGDLTVFHLLRYRDYLDARFKVTGRNQYYSDACRLIEFLPSRPDVLWQARKRRRVESDVKPIVRYTVEQFAAIQHSARNTVRKAHRRITAAYAEALRGEDPASTPRQRALFETLALGQPQSRDAWEAIGCWRNSRGLIQDARLFLYPTHSEILAAAVLIACQRGLNLSPIVTVRAPRSLDESIVQLDVDKPRRGPGARFWPEIMDDTGEDKGAASAIAMIAEITNPVRDHLERSGKPSDRLLIWWTRSERPVLQLRQRRTSPWWPIAEPLNFMRLRRSVPDRGVGKEPTHHHPSTHLHYIRTDPIALQEQQAAASDGVQSALDRARKELAIDRVADQDAEPANDALIVSCTDPARRPDTGRPCVTAFFSFLDCLECDNAVTANRLLPRQVAALSVLEQLRDVAGDSWSAAYGRRVHLLEALVERSTAAEKEAAAAEVNTFRPLVVAALRNEIPDAQFHLFG